MSEKRPPHPGEVLRTRYLDPCGILPAKLADAIDVSRKHVSLILSGEAPVRADTALRLAVALNTTPELWLELQAAYDLWELRQVRRPRVKRLTDGRQARQ